jgi:hypothetical protein
MGDSAPLATQLESRATRLSEGWRPSVDVDAGLRGAAAEAESPFKFGAERRPVFLRTPRGAADLPPEEALVLGRAQRPAVLRGGDTVPRLRIDEAPIKISGTPKIDVDAGLAEAAPAAKQPLYPKELKLDDLFTRAAEERPVHLAGDVFRTGKAEASAAGPIRLTDIGIDADAGLTAEVASKRAIGLARTGPRPVELLNPNAGVGAEAEGVDVLGLSRSKRGLRPVEFSPDGDLSAFETVSPIKINKGEVGIGSAPLAAKPVTPPTIATWLERQAGEHALRSAGADKALVRRLDRFAPGGHEGVGKLLAEEAPALVGKQRVGQMSKELWQEAAVKGKQTYGKAMDAVIESGSKAGNTIRAADVIDEIRAVSKPFREDFAHIGKADIVKRIDGFADDVARRSGLIDEAGAVINVDAQISLKELHGIRRSADDLWAGNKINPIATPIKGVRDAVDARLVSELERAGGEELKTAWKDATVRWQAFHALEKAAANASAKSGANQFLSLTDSIFSAAGSTAGSLVGGPIGAMAGGAVAGLASKMFRARFDALAADALLRASQLGAARQLTGAVDAQIESGVRGFLAGTGSGGKGEFAAALPQGAKAGQVTRTEFEKLTQQVANAAAARKSSPGFAEQEASKKLGAFAAAAPNVTAILANRHAAAVDFLSASMPRARVDESAMYVPSSLPSPKTLSPEELRWVRRHEATTDPMGVIRDMQKGRVTHDQIDALKAVYPSLYRQVKTRMIESVQGHGKAVSVEQATQLGILLGEPTHFMLRPEYLAAMQASKGAAVPVAQAEGPAAAGPRGKPDFATDAPERATTMQEDIEK